MYLIVGLGNPGARYESTRHNIGFKTIDFLSHDLGVRLTGRSFQSKNIQINLKNKKVMLFCPLTFMNQSGMAVRACAEYYGLEIGNLLVIHDDVDLPVGRLKVVRDSGAGGHKGVKSIIDYLGSVQFPRIKIGIGRPRYGETIEDYVLAPFYSDEKDIMEKVLHLATQACRLFISEGVERAMNHVNCQKLANEEEKN